jgi:hypothetical protein
MSKWQPIDTLPEGEHVLLWFPHGERGIGGMECGTCFWEEWLVSVRRLCIWTHGGPNAGSDWEPCDDEMPTHWMPLPEPPK